MGKNDIFFSVGFDAYFEVDYKARQRMKSMGGTWDGELKTWYLRCNYCFDDKTIVDSKNHDPVIKLFKILHVTNWFFDFDVNEMINDFNKMVDDYHNDFNENRSICYFEIPYKSIDRIKPYYDSKYNSDLKLWSVPVKCLKHKDNKNKVILHDRYHNEISNLNKLVRIDNVKYTDEVKNKIINRFNY